MKQASHDLLQEYEELDALCARLDAAQWSLRSSFFGWTPWDEIAHLCYFDETALQAATDASGFTRSARELQARDAAGEAISAIARDRYGHLDGPALLAHWRTRYSQLVATLTDLDPKARLPWYGPPMSARSFATARLMETWAHGQDIWDVTEQQRAPTLRLKHIAHLGVTTFGWTFVNRGLPVPKVSPYLCLAAGDGSVWEWGDPSSSEAVRGDALDFCLVVTQRRHVADTDLDVTGEAAQEWMRLAQCFAGPPADGPAPGVRGTGR